MKFTSSAPVGNVPAHRRVTFQAVIDAFLGTFRIGQVRVALTSQPQRAHLIL